MLCPRESGLCRADRPGRPSDAPPLEMLWLTMPTTSPVIANIGPPEFPVLMVAVVRKNSAKGIVLSAGKRTKHVYYFSGLQWAKSSVPQPGKNIGKATPLT